MHLKPILIYAQDCCIYEGFARISPYAMCGTNVLRQQLPARAI